MEPSRSIGEGGSALTKGREAQGHKMARDRVCGSHPARSHLELPADRTPLFCTILFAIFILYCIYDIVSWPREPSVWLFGLMAIAAGAYFSLV